MEDIEKKISSYGYSEEVNILVTEIVNIIVKNSLPKGEEAIARKSVELCNEVKSGKMLPKFADDFFTLLNIFLGDHFSEVVLDCKIKDLILEGMSLHDFGKPFGADIETMNHLAVNYLMK